MEAMPGIPCIYYGSEWGCEGKKGKYSDDYLRPCFEKAEWNALTDTIQKLNTLHTSISTFTNGDYTQLYIQNKQLVFKRCDENGQLIFCMNIGNDPATVYFDAGCESGIDLFTDHEIKFTGSLNLERKSFKIIYTKW